MRFPIRFFPEQTTIPFMRFRWFGFACSALLMAATIGVLLTKGLTLGIDFTGGILLEVRTEKPANLASLRTLLNAQDYGEISLQNFGSDREVLIRIQATGDKQGEKVKEIRALLTSQWDDSVEFRKVDYVGPSVGEELVEAGYLSLSIAFAAVMLYVWFRFEWQFGVGAIAALLHDAILIVGFYAISGFDFGLTSIAAILTIIGYSINDSVVIYDRIRENMRRFKQMELEEILNRSINETLSRTVLTAGTTILAAGALAVFGGEIIKGFSIALLFGVIAGTYSSIYIAAPILIYFNLRPWESEAKPQHG